MSVLVQRGVRETLVRMALPMLAGTFAMNAYYLADAWFVSKLGTQPLAAMAFTIPVVTLLTFVAGGIGTGITTLVSHALGRHDHDDAARLVTHGIALTVTFTTVVSIAGFLTVDAVFRRLGADATTLPLIGQFMRIWYLGALTMSLPMMGNGILISCGDSRNASRLMVFGSALNVILNPILIFGPGGLPALGMRGSALATVISQTVSMSWLLYLLSRKHHLLRFRSESVVSYLVSWRRILGFAIPCVVSMAMLPISIGIITWIMSRFGSEAVAASGAATRLEMFAFVVPMALGISLTPFVSQNFAARRIDRIHEAQKLSASFALLYGGAVALLFIVAAPRLAGIFSDDPQVTRVMIAYLRIIPLGYGMMEVHRYCGFMLTGLQDPPASLALNMIRIIVLLIPLSWLGAHWFGLQGMFAGRLITDATVGSVGLAWVSLRLRSTASTADR
jgi:putative MATE family efflux protein